MTYASVVRSSLPISQYPTCLVSRLQREPARIGRPASRRRPCLSRRYENRTDRVEVLMMAASRRRGDAESQMLTTILSPDAGHTGRALLAVVVPSSARSHPRDTSVPFETSYIQRVCVLVPI